MLPVLLGLWAAGCTLGSDPTPTEVAQGVPEGWVWTTSSRGYEVAFPGFPTLVERPDRVKLEDGSALAVVFSRGELVQKDGGFVVAVAPQAPGGIAEAGGPEVVTRAMARHVASSLSGELVDVGAWDGSPGGTEGTIAVPTGRYARVRAGVGPDRVVFAQANSPSYEAVKHFMDSFHPIDAVAPVPVSIGAVGSVSCPSRCGPFSDRARVGANVATLSGFRGMLDLDRFEGVWAELAEGTDPQVAMDALRDRFVKRVKGHVLEERADPLGEAPGWRTRYQTGRAVGEIRVVVIDRTVIAIEAHAPLGGLPEWVEVYLGSISAR